MVIHFGDPRRIDIARSTYETFRRAGGWVVDVSARGSEGRRFDTRVNQLSD